MIIINNVVLIGRAVREPELKVLPNSDNAVTTMTLAVDRRFKKEGQPDADFIPVVIWGKQAESTAKFVGKGKLVAVSGRIQTRSYENKEGNRVYITEIVAEQVKFLEWANNDGKKEDSFGDMEPIQDTDIPF